jgi:hypothetical protein
LGGGITEKVTVREWEILIEGKRGTHAILGIQITKASNIFRNSKKKSGGRVSEEHETK